MHNTCGFLFFPQAVLKVLARLKYSELLYKTEDEFLIPAEECMTFESVSSSFFVFIKSFKLATTNL